MRVLCCCCCCCYWLLLLLVLAAPWPAEGLVCISHHEYYEDGKTRVINLGRCGSSNGFCVKAHYWDKDESQKRGFSRGCDKNDCVHFGEQEYGWRPDGCRKHKDFGSEGLICCCQRDLCNGSPALGFSISTLFTFYLLLVLSSLLLRSILF
ncbi:hypothetical protein Tcan_00962, partial [Toxocara canis]|uniref:Activin_recp domain-containing protein n=2 Tax=Toxocara canis TaxID=6265 RepID=A0A183UJ38_TOXCA